MLPQTHTHSCFNNFLAFIISFFIAPFCSATTLHYFLLERYIVPTILREVLKHFSYFSLLRSRRTKHTHAHTYTLGFNLREISLSRQIHLPTYELTIHNPNQVYLAHSHFFLPLFLFHSVVHTKPFVVFLVGEPVGAL